MLHTYLHSLLVTHSHVTSIIIIWRIKELNPFNRASLAPWVMPTKDGLRSPTIVSMGNIGSCKKQFSILTIQINMLKFLKKNLKVKKLHFIWMIEIESCFCNFQFKPYTYYWSGPTIVWDLNPLIINPIGQAWLNSNLMYNYICTPLTMRKIMNFLFSLVWMEDEVVDCQISMNTCKRHQ